MIKRMEVSGQMVSSNILKRLVCLGLVFGFLAGKGIVAQGQEGDLMPGQWSIEKAWKWYNTIGLIKGCNYNPRTSINSTEMWQAETFDPETINQELGWAQECGYNSIRVFLQFLVWRYDPDGMIQRMEQFLQIADKHKIKVMFVPFDDCQFSGVDPYLGPQKDPVPGVSNGHWMASPGHKSVTDKAVWPYLEQYIKAIVGRFGRDDRVLIWDLYNEAGNSGAGDMTLSLVVSSFEWAKEINPSQPITSCQPLIKTISIHGICDFLTFHNYSGPSTVEKKIIQLQNYGRPVVNTEWLHRPNGSTVEQILPIFRKYGVGWYHWGLVAGRSQTYMHWRSKTGDLIPEKWQHDVLFSDGTPYRKEEMELLGNFTFESLAIDLLAGRWSVEKAEKWYEGISWLIGCNFLPSTAVNSKEMWQDSTFDAETIDRELGWAANVGFNTIRVFLQLIVWEADPDGFKQRIDKFLSSTEKHGISVMFILFDDCFKPEPILGKQQEPVPGVHNSQWTSCPGKHRKRKDNWPELENYVRDIVDTFANDSRVVVWDLYNEPKDGSIPLVKKAFIWARQVKPSQPLTVGAYNVTFDDDASQQVMRLSDVVSFHSYNDIKVTTQKVQKCFEHGRPVFCTEYMSRPMKSTFKTHLPLFKKYKVGAYNWGLVAGRTQTYMPWGSKEGSPEPKQWFHDILRADGTPYDPAELEIIEDVTEYKE